MADQKPAEKKPAPEKPAEEEAAEETPAVKKARVEKGDEGGVARDNVENYKIHLSKVFNHVLADIEISSEAISIMNALINYYTEKIARKATSFVAAKKPTCNLQVMETALRLTFPEHAMSETMKVFMKKFTSS